jgi:hypothetical protein
MNHKTLAIQIPQRNRIASVLSQRQAALPPIRLQSWFMKPRGTTMRSSPSPTQQLRSSQWGQRWKIALAETEQYRHQQASHFTGLTNQDRTPSSAAS